MLWELITKIEEFKGTWRALGTLAPERFFSLSRVATIEIIGSSTRVLKAANSRTVRSKHCLGRLEIKNLTIRDEQEVTEYAQVVELVCSSWPYIAFTEMVQVVP